MPLEFSEEELRRTAHNLERLRDFLIARRSWSVPGGVEDACTVIRETSTALTAAIDALGAEEAHDGAGHEDLPNPLPAGELDGERLRKFAKFLEQLRVWFAGRQGWTVPSGATDATSSIRRFLIGTRSAIDEILARSGAGGDAAEDDGSAPVEEDAAAEGPDEPEVLYPPNPDARLVVEDTHEAPALQEFRGQIELAYEAKGRLMTFLEENHVSFNSYEQHAFEAKVVRWIQATPEGSALVIKVSGLQGKIEPYPTYAPKTQDQAE